MSSFQRTIKYIAVAFAVMLAVTIISGIASTAYMFIQAFSDHDNSKSKATVDYSESFTGVKKINIENSSGNLIIKTGDQFLVEAENVSEDFNAKLNAGGTLTITDRREFEFLWFNVNGFHNPNSKITVYLPSDFIAQETELSTGAGTVTVENLNTERLIISAGAGNVNGSGLTAERVIIDGGVGNIDLQDVNFSDADIDCGVGNLTIDGILLGKTKIDCGVGSVALDLQGHINDYDLEVDSGMGTIRLNGEKILDDYETDNNADNRIKIDGGMGNVTINIK